MHTVILPKIEPNMEQALLIAWLKKEGDPVKAGEPLFEIETAKTLIEVEAEHSGILRKILVPAGTMVPILTPLAFVGDAQEPLPDLTAIPQKQESSEEQKAPLFPAAISLSAETSNRETEQMRASPAARKLAREKNVDMHAVKGTGPEGRIREADVLSFFTILKKDEPKILIIGAGRGGEVVSEILSTTSKIIGFLDDNAALWGKKLKDIPIVGGTDLAEKLFAEGKCNRMSISITANMQVRKALYERLKKTGCPLVNAIHQTSYISPSAKIGEGNIIGAFVHIGCGTSIGHNNLITAHCNIEHHNTIGSHSLFGPGVMTSGNVTIGDSCSLGAGVNIEPHVMIGDGVAIASGSTLITNIHSHTTVRRELRI